MDLLGLACSGLLGEKDSLDVWQDTTLGDGDSGQQLVQFLVVADGELEMSWNNPRFLVVSGCVASQLEYFSCQILHDGRKVHWSSSTDTLGVVSLSQQTMDTTDWELQTGS